MSFFSDSTLRAHENVFRSLVLSQRSNLRRLPPYSTPFHHRSLRWPIKHHLTLYFLEPFPSDLFLLKVVQTDSSLPLSHHGESSHSDSQKNRILRCLNYCKLMTDLPWSFFPLVNKHVLFVCTCPKECLPVLCHVSTFVWKRWCYASSFTVLGRSHISRHLNYRPSIQSRWDYQDKRNVLSSVLVDNFHFFFFSLDPSDLSSTLYQLCLSFSHSMCLFVSHNGLSPLRVCSKCHEGYTGQTMEEIVTSRRVLYYQPK